MAYFRYYQKPLLGREGSRREKYPNLSHPLTDLLQTPPSAHIHLEAEGKVALGTQGREGQRMDMEGQ